MVEIWLLKLLLVRLMPKTQSLYTSAQLNLGDRVLGEVEKKSFIALPGKGGHSRLLPLKTVCPHPGGFGEEFFGFFFNFIYFLFLAALCLRCCVRAFL